ncbi:MAG TPA: aspartyl protease family protein [Gemmatimonadales bacterium]|jgi:hypothetical protein|nr:aspartyl protease family protein [Gemmatimonadales bacterium]
MRVCRVFALLSVLAPPGSAACQRAPAVRIPIPFATGPLLAIAGDEVTWQSPAYDTTLLFTADASYHNHALRLLVDLGTDRTLVWSQRLPALDLPHAWSNGAVTRTVRTRGKVDLRHLPASVDTAASLVIPFRDSVQEVWYSDAALHATILDVLLVGQRRFDHVATDEMPGGIDRVDGILGIDLLTGFDLEFNRKTGRFAMYEPDATALPAGLVASDCTPARITSVPRWLHSYAITTQDIDGREHIDTAIHFVRDMTPTGGLDARQQAVREFRIPVSVNGRINDALFDPGANATIMNWEEAALLGITRSDPRLHVDRRYDATTVVNAPAIDGIRLAIGNRRLADAPVVISDGWFAETYYNAGPGPRITLGLDALRDRVLFLGWRSARVCVAGG